MATKQSGQTLPLVALMMVCIMGVAALAVDGSNAYSQQRRMQADLDMAVKVAADDLPTTGTAQTDATNLLTDRGYTNPGITINVPPQTAPYMQKSCPPSIPEPCYAEGFLTQNVRSFFAGVLGRQSLKISVHAVAEKGGHTWQPPQLLALSPTGASNGGCGVLAQGGAGVSGVLKANVHSDSQSCVKSGSIYAAGSVTSDITTAANNGYPITGTVNGSSGNGTGTFMPNPYNPGWTVPPTSTLLLPGFPKTCNTAGGCSYCKNYTVNNGDTYYAPAFPTGVVMPSGFQTSHGNYDFLPYCDDPATGKATGGIYLFKNDLKLSSTSSQNAPVVKVYDSTFVFDYSSGAKIDVTGGALKMWGPGTCFNSYTSNGNTDFCNPVTATSNIAVTSPFSGTFGSIAIWQYMNPPAPCSNPVSGQLGGNATGTIFGIVDLACTDITVTGNSSNSSWISGALVAWDITIAGSGSGIVTQNPVDASGLPSGAVLVQ
jgi:Putative Flp pilus-assembly TadE/G-like